MYLRRVPGLSPICHCPNRLMDVPVDGGSAVGGSQRRAGQQTEEAEGRFPRIV